MGHKILTGSNPQLSMDTKLLINTVSGLLVYSLTLKKLHTHLVTNIFIYYHLVISADDRNM